MFFYLTLVLFIISIVVIYVNKENEVWKRWYVRLVIFLYLLSIYIILLSTWDM